LNEAGFHGMDAFWFGFEESSTTGSSTRGEYSQHLLEWLGGMSAHLLQDDLQHAQDAL
jgi:hypothetical protein